MIPNNCDTTQSFQKMPCNFDNFVLEPAEIKQIDTFIANKGKPFRIMEVLELIISNRLKKIAQLNQTQLYSPMDKYSVGDRILFCFPNNKFVIGEILWIEKGHESSQFGRYDQMGVSLQGFKEEKKYVSNCPAFSRCFYARARPKDGFLLPANIVNEQKEKLTPTVISSLSQYEEFVNIDDNWFVRRALPEIRFDELELCYGCIKQNGMPLSGKFLICKVLKIAPESEKFEAFLFSLNYILQYNDRFVKCKIAEEIQWDIRRPVPPKTVQNTLTQEAIEFGFIRITKGLRDLLEYCNLSREITFKAYGEYEIHGYIDNEASQIYGDQIKVWFEENQLKPGDIIHINSPDNPGENPILYTTFQKLHVDKPKEDVDEKDHIHQVNLRHRIHNLLKSRNQCLHAKEIQRLISQSVSKPIELSTVQMILSHNKHLFIREPNSRGIWGLTIWIEKRPEIDPISLGLAIKEDDWVYRTLEKVGIFLTVDEMAKELAMLFATHKDKVVEITFLDANDMRLIELNGKWGLKVWIENWKKRVLEIDKEILDYQNLVCSRSGLEEQQKVKQTESLGLEGEKATLQRSLSDSISKIQSIEHKMDICLKRRKELHEKNTFVQQQLGASKHRRLNYLCATALIVISGFLHIIGGTHYKVLGIILLLTAAVYMIRSSKTKRNRINIARTTESSIIRLDHRLTQLNKYVSDLKSEEILIRTEIASSDTKFKQHLAAVENLQGKIDDITEEVTKHNVPLLHQEKESLIQRMKAAGVT